MLTTSHTDATEHANDDSGSDATEHAATIAVLTTPAFDAATDDITVGPCRLRCMKNELWILFKMNEEIERRFRVPVSLKQLLQKYEHTRFDADWSPTRFDAGGASKSWSATVESISRCTAAFQKATDATEHIQCQTIATKICDYAIALVRKTPVYCSHEDVLKLVHQFMQNRTYNLAFIHLLNQACLSEYEDGTFWNLLLWNSSQKEACLRTIEVCMDAIRNHERHLQRRMEAYKL